MILNIAFLGDIVGKNGRNFVKKNIDKLKKDFNLNMLIANAENASGGMGLGANEAKELKAAGVDLMTVGDHCYDNETTFDFLNSKENDFCISPFNLINNPCNKKFIVYKIGNVNVVLVSILGKVMISREVENPFLVVDDLLQEIEKLNLDNKIIIVDFHAEATAEKKALGLYLAGRVSAVFGTHTHVQTNDARILEEKTAYITDAGMCGPRDGVIGMDYKYSIERLTQKREKGFKVANTPSFINGVFFSIDTDTKNVLEVRGFCIEQQFLESNLKINF